MGKLELTVALGDYDRTSALRTGLICPEGVELNVLTLSPEEMFYLPYGIARNRANIETLVGHSHRQGLAPRRLTIPEMFVESLLDT
jgi:hypothetical protein